MSQQEISLVRRYLHSSAAMPHYRREVLRPQDAMAPSTPEGRLNVE